MEKNLKRIILGIDVSTSCLGVSIVSHDETETKLLLKAQKHYFLRVGFSGSNFHNYANNYALRI